MGLCSTRFTGADHHPPTDRVGCPPAQPAARRSRVTWQERLGRSGGGVAERDFDELYQAQYGNVVALAYALTGTVLEPVNE